jgi:hypothetical protein
LAEYKPLRDAFLAENKECEVRYDGCTKKATEVHHMAGRTNKMLCDVQYFLPICRSCHRKVTDDSAGAIENGFSKRRIT